MKVLHIEASPSKAISRTRAVALHFLAALQRERPDAHVSTLDIWAADLPAFDDQMIAAKFAVLRSQLATEEQRAVWSRAAAFSQAFNEADLYLISVPMWNFSVPYRLKHYIDVVTLPGSNWTWSAARGYRGLLVGKRAVLVYSSAGAYAVSGDTEGDFQKAYLRRWLNFVGIDDISEINAAPTLAAPEEVARTVEGARAQAAQMAIDEALRFNEAGL